MLRLRSSCFSATASTFQIHFLGWFLTTLLALLPHRQDLHHPDEDVDEVKFEADTLVHGIPLDDTPLRQPGIVEDLLHIIKGEPAEDGKTAP